MCRQDGDHVHGYRFPYLVSWLVELSTLDRLQDADGILLHSLQHVWPRPSGHCLREDLSTHVLRQCERVHFLQ